jgi:hypothetical protein
MDKNIILAKSIDLLAFHWEGAEKVFRAIGLKTRAVDVLRDGTTRWGWAKRGKDWQFVWYDGNGGANPLSGAPLNVRIEAASRLDILVSLCEVAQAELVDSIEQAAQRLDDWKSANKE